MKPARIIIDAIMTALLPVLMAYSLVGESLHEIFGTAMLALFIAHHILNRRATAAAFRGRQSPARVFRTAVDLLLFAVMLLLPLSGIMLSKHLYTWLPTDGLAATARTVHLLASYWGFALMSLHLGLHLGRFLPRRRSILIAVSAVLTLIAAYGVYAFIRRGIGTYMFLESQFVFFDFSEPRIFFFLDYLAVMILFAWVGYGVNRGLRCIGGKRRDGA